MKFKVSFKLHGSMLRSGTRYILKIPGLALFYTSHDCLCVKHLFKNNAKDLYISYSYLSTTTWNSIELIGDGYDSIKVKANSYTFTLLKEERYQNYIISGNFSNDNHLRFSSYFLNTEQPSSWEFQVEFTQFTNSTDFVGIVGNDTQYAGGNIVIYRRTVDNKLRYQLRLLNGSSGRIAIVGETEMPLNQSTIARVRYDEDTGYDALLSFDNGRTYILDGHVDDTSKVYISESYSYISLGFGYSTQSNNLTAFDGTFDLTKFYFKKNGGYYIDYLNNVGRGLLTQKGTLTKTIVGEEYYYPTISVGDLNLYGNSWLLIKDIEALKLEA